MTKTRHEADLEASANVFKALGHPVRLLIINLMRIKPRHGQELATVLSLKPATISHHLAKLSEAGLIESRKDQYYQVYSLAGDALDKSLGEVASIPRQCLAEQVEEGGYRARVLRTFLRHGRLKKIPRQLKKRQVILERIVEEFEPMRDYTEIEVNRELLEFHEDVATLRREMVGLGMLRRSKGIYRRTA
jgi:DNA-binding HxlR family transcriptional regulator